MKLRIVNNKWLSFFVFICTVFSDIKNLNVWIFIKSDDLNIWIFIKNDDLNIWIFEKNIEYPRKDYKIKAQQLNEIS